MNSRSGLYLACFFYACPWFAGAGRAGFLNRFNKAKVICRSADPCCFCRPPEPRHKEEDKPWPQMHFDLPHVSQWLASGEKPVILHIGPNDGAENEAAFYQLLVRMAQESGMELRLIFLEPLPSAAAMLRRRLYRFLGPNQSVEVLTAAVCPTGAGTAPVLYTLSREVPPETSSKVALFFNRGSYLSSLSWDRFDHSLREFADFSKRRDSHFSRAEQQEIDALLKTQIVTIPVSCPSVFELLEDLQLDISDLGLLIIDAEGVDTMLLQDFLSLPSFKPSVVQWEYVHSDAYPSRSAYRNATFQVVKRMAARGYDVMAIMGDMVAVLPERS